MDETFAVQIPELGHVGGTLSSVPWGAAPLADPAPPEGRGSTDGAG